MTTDIRLHTTFLRHPKTVKLMRKCGPEGVISLLKLWLWVREEKPDGIIDGGPDDIEIAAEWEGPPNLFYDTLIDVRFIIKQDSGKITLRNWAKRNPWAVGAVTRQLKAKKGGCAKHGKKCEECKDDCPNSAQSCYEQKRAPAPSPSPLLSSPSLLPKKEEKPLPEQALRLAGILADEILKRLPDKFELLPEKKEASVKRWAVDIDKLNRLNKQSWEIIEEVLLWAQADSFWQNNVLSGQKFRERFDQLRLKMDENPQGDNWMEEYR